MIKEERRSDILGRLLLACGVAAPAVFTILVVVASSLRPGYSQVGQYISDLESGSDITASVQRVNFVLTGLLSIAFVSGLYRISDRTRVSTVGVATLAIFSCTSVGVGLFSCDPGCPIPGSSVSQMVHNLLTLIGFVAVVLAPPTVSKGLKNYVGSRTYPGYSLATGIISLALLVVFLLGAVLSGVLFQWTGLFQRMFLAVPWLWVEITAVMIVTRQPDS